MFPEYEYRNTALVIIEGKKFASYPARFHRHVEIAYVREGFMDVSIDAKSYSLGEGDLYIVFPDLLHSIRKADAVKDLILISPELPYALRETLSRYKPVCPVLRAGEISPFVGALCARMRELARADFQGSYPQLSAHANALLWELMKKLELEERSSDSNLVQQLVMHLLENYTEEISLDTVAASLGYSKYHLSHVIADTFGCNFRSLLNSYRVSMAQNLLLSSSRSVGEVAFACGFRNQSSFNRIFLQHCGTTPSEFRRRANTVPSEPQLVLK